MVTWHFYNSSFDSQYIELFLSREVLKFVISILHGANINPYMKDGVLKANFATDYTI